MNNDQKEDQAELGQGDGEAMQNVVDPGKAMNIAAIAGIVTWVNNGTRRPCGQIMGADGSGEFARVFMGDDVLDANTKMREFIKELLTQQEYRGHIEIRSVILNDEGYHGKPITIENLDE